MKVKKIAALAVGAAVAGATLGFASAQGEVPEIPKDFFVKDGKPNVKIVVGSEGAAMDVVSAADIAAAIGSLLYTEKDVEVTDATVVARKDVTEPIEKIPVFDNYDTNTAHKYKVGDNLKDVPAWWNGSDFVANFSTSVWNDGVYDKAVEIRIDNIGSVGSYDLAANLTLKGIALDGITDSEVDVIDDFEDFTVNVSTVVANISLVVYNYTLKGQPTVDKITKDETIPEVNLITNLFLDNSTLAKFYPDYDGYTIEGVKVLKSGVGEGETLKILDNEYPIVFIGKDIQETACGDCFTYGKDWGEDYYNQGETYNFGDYKVTILDIDVARDKAFIKVESPSGDTETTTLAVGGTEAQTFFDGGIRIQIKDTFVGISGTNAVKLHVWTDLKTVKSGDEIMPGWIAEFKVDSGKIIWFALENKNTLSDKRVPLFNTYAVDYKATIRKKKKDDVEYGTLTAYIYIEPLETQYETVEAAIGESIDDYEVVDVKAEVSPEVAYIPQKLTAPITVLDTEVLEQGLENVGSNLILVGGPVVNKVTAALAEDLGVPLTYEEWAEKFGTGKEGWTIVYKEQCGKIGGYGVVLVAGSDREGTRAAAEALLDYIANLE
ncbi:S-layer protein [Pyrococcus furiosus DSM 3638]|uniref:S-layer protein n=3 Tax=Pyrococcus furiosus TaxID=2261 RepID=A0A5C0XQN4_PYRFU|nr:S-layer protein [Pyrococcus furiosus]AAL81523.1 putative ATPase, vanadate-sensitive [Pyrococcus furiosus DSM 3638]AFN04180.1 ATPase, vanadate-sensitive [Pyrococcus furiosus COM1]QEK79031.1 S-layer protein [Pyrococcus furiosus DSM 3638]